MEIKYYILDNYYLLLVDICVTKSDDRVAIIYSNVCGETQIAIHENENCFAHYIKMHNYIKYVLLTFYFISYKNEK